MAYTGRLLICAVTGSLIFCCKKGNTSSGSNNPEPPLITITLDDTKQFQEMEGFGGFGAQDVYWSNGPFTSGPFVNTLINDLGLTILRDNLPTDFEFENDNNDPFVTDLDKYHLHGQTSGYDQPLGVHLQYLKDMKNAGLQKMITTVWSPPAWMKTNGRVNNGTRENSAPSYNTNPSGTDNQLRTDMYEEFAEMCVAYIKVIKQETGIDVYAFSIQNEPRFSQYYESCVYNGGALRDLLKIVGRRFSNEGLSTKLFLPEDVGWIDGVRGMLQPSLDDTDARQYAGIVAVHGYALDGITAASPDAQAWKTMYGWGSQFGKPLWMTETSGFSNNIAGAMDLARAMYTAINFGNVSAWLFWSLSTSTLDSYSLMSSSGAKSKRYYISKNFYRYIMPGARRFQASSPESSQVLSMAFINDAEKSTTIILINNDKENPVRVKVEGSGVPIDFIQFVTSEEDDCVDMGKKNAKDILMLPANSVTTLYQKD